MGLLSLGAPRCWEVQGISCDNIPPTTITTPYLYTSRLSFNTYLSLPPPSPYLPINGALCWRVVFASSIFLACQGKLSLRGFRVYSGPPCRSSFSLLSPASSLFCFCVCLTPGSEVCIHLCGYSVALFLPLLGGMLSSKNFFCTPVSYSIRSWNFLVKFERTFFSKICFWSEWVIWREIHTTIVFSAWLTFFWVVSFHVNSRCALRLCHADSHKRQSQL